MERLSVQERSEIKTYCESMISLIGIDRSNPESYKGVSKYSVSIVISEEAAIYQNVLNALEESDSYKIKNALEQNADVAELMKDRFSLSRESQSALSGFIRSPSKDTFDELLSRREVLLRKMISVLDSF